MSQTIGKFPSVAEQLVSTLQTLAQLSSGSVAMHLDLDDIKALSLYLTEIAQPDVPVWFSTSTPPVEDEFVLICQSHAVPSTGYFHSGRWYDEGQVELTDVFAWAKLPDTPDERLFL